MKPDFLMMANGIRTAQAQRRFHRYLEYCADPILSTTAVVLKYKGQVDAVVLTPAGLAQHGPCRFNTVSCVCFMLENIDKKRTQ